MIQSPSQLPKSLMNQNQISIQGQKNDQEQNKLFVLSEQTNYTFKQQYQKILGFSPMLNNTCVILAIKSHQVQCVAHIDIQGKVLKQITFKGTNFYPYAIISNKQIVWLNPDENIIYQWNLQTYQLLQFNFIFLNYQVCDSHEIFVFPQTKLICIGQWGNHNSNVFKLTYYKYPLAAQSEPVVEPFQSESVWNYQQMVRRANISSKILWFKSNQKQFVEFTTYQLKHVGNQYYQSQENVIVHKTHNPFQNGNATAQLSIGNIWEISDNKYMIIAVTDRQKQNNIYPNSIFVYEQKNKLLRQAKFSLEGRYRFQIVDYFSFGNTSMIKTFNFHQGNVQQTPVYFIDNQKQCISAKQKWKCSHLNKYTFPAFDPNLVVDAQYENGNVTNVNSRMIRVVSPKEIYTNWMIQIVEDVDEDLINNVTQLL